MNSDELTPQQIREACIRMNGAAKTRREILAKIAMKKIIKMTQEDLVDGKGPKFTHEVMDLEDELLKVKMELAELRKLLNL